MENIIWFSEPEEDTRLKALTLQMDGESTIKNIYLYLKQYGAVRDDVYEFLVEKGEELCKAEYNFLIELIRCQASREWFELILQTGKEKVAPPLYRREIIEAYKQGICIEDLTEFYKNAKCPYDMTAFIRNYIKGEYPKEETFSKEQELEKKVQEYEAEIVRLKEEIEKWRMQAELGKEEHEQIPMGLKEEFTAIEDGSYEELEEKMPEEIIESGIPTDAIAPEEKISLPEMKEKYRKKVSLLQRIRSFRHKAALEKMSEQRKMEELFILMREQHYTPAMIRSIRSVIEYGISFDFLYAYVESGATEKELDALVMFKTPSKEFEPDFVVDEEPEIFFESYDEGE